MGAQGPCSKSEQVVGAVAGGGQARNNRRQWVLGDKAMTVGRITRIALEGVGKYATCPWALPLPCVGPRNPLPGGGGGGMRGSFGALASRANRPTDPRQEDCQEDWGK